MLDLEPRSARWRKRLIRTISVLSPLGVLLLSVISIRHGRLPLEAGLLGVSAIIALIGAMLGSERESAEADTEIEDWRRIENIR